VAARGVRGITWPRVNAEAWAGRGTAGRCRTGRPRGVCAAVSAPGRDERIGAGGLVSFWRWEGGGRGEVAVPVRWLGGQSRAFSVLATIDRRHLNSMVPLCTSCSIGTRFFLEHKKPAAP
jgi:hypothetical protein